MLGARVLARGRLLSTFLPYDHLQPGRHAAMFGRQPDRHRAVLRGAHASSTSFTFWVSSFSVNGFGRNAASAMPLSPPTKASSA
jgi:hypothetical protein